MANYTDWKNNIDNLNSFYRGLHFTEQDKLLQDFEFKAYIYENLTNVQVADLIKFDIGYDALKLFDEKFAELISLDDVKKFEYLYEHADKDALYEIFLKDYGEKFMCFSCISKVLTQYCPIDVKRKILEIATSSNVDEKILANITYNTYYEAYERGVEKDYSVNKKEIEMIKSLMEDDAISAKYYKSFDLLSSLDIENRSNFYAGARYEDLDEIDKKNLKKLLIHGYETYLPASILSDNQFLRDLAKIKDLKDYRMVKLMIKDLDVQAFEVLENFRGEICNKLIDEIERKPLNKLEDVDLAKNLIFENYFKCEVSDVFIKACAIKDAINSIPGYAEKISNDGLYLIDSIIQFVDISKFNKIKQEKVLKAEDIADNMQIDETNYENFQDVLLILKTRNDWDRVFEKAIDYARKYFVQDLNNHLYQPKQEDLIENEDGLAVYDVSKLKNFNILIHRTEINNDRYVFPNTEEGNYLNTSMSVINNNHLAVFHEDTLEDDGIIFGYKSAGVDEVVHALPKDSYSNLTGHKPASLKYANAESDSVPVYVSFADFMANTPKSNEGKDYINEIKLHAKPNRGNQFVPDFIVCKNLIRPIDKQIAKKYNLPIVFINEKEVQKFNEGDFYKPMLYDKHSIGGLKLNNTFVEL